MANKAFAPFDDFAVASNAEEKNGSDPWSDATWGGNLVNVSFDNASFADADDLFEFSAVASANALTRFDGKKSGGGGGGLSSRDAVGGRRQHPVDFVSPETDLFFPGDPFAVEANGPSTNNKDVGEGQDLVAVSVTVHEQLSALYDDVPSDPACQIEGTIRVRASASGIDGPFCLVLRDVLGHVKRLDDRAFDVCEDITDSVQKRRGLHKADRVLLVHLPPDAHAKEIPVANYHCVPKLRPVPMLVKSRVQASAKHSRLGFKIRANPSNQHPISRMVIIVAVPPYVDGTSIKMSRTGGVWDEMKRTVTWVVERLIPGEALEVQAQFESVDEGDEGRVPKFPLLVRCYYPVLFSSVEVNADLQHGDCIPVQIHTSQSATILHRKV